MQVPIIPWLLIRNGELIEYKADKMPVGKHVGEERPFSSHRIPVGERVMYSTSFQMGSPISLVVKKEGSISPFLSDDCCRVSVQNPWKTQQKLLEKELNGVDEGCRSGG